MAEQGSNPREIRLGKDFGDVVIIAGNVRIEIHNDEPPKVFAAAAKQGSATPLATSAAANVGNGSRRILKLAEAVAREYKHSTITLNHLLLALSQDNPEALEKIISPQIRVSTLQALLRKDLQAKGQPQKLEEGAMISITRTAAYALKLAEVSSLELNRSDQLFGPELLHALLRVRKTDKSDRSTPLDFVAMTLSRHGDLDVAEECRKKIDDLAKASGEGLSDKEPKRLIPRPPGAVTYDPEL